MSGIYTLNCFRFSLCSLAVGVRRWFISSIFILSTVAF